MNSFEIGELVVRIFHLTKEYNEWDKIEYDQQWGYGTRIDGYKMSDTEEMSDLFVGSTKSVLTASDDDPLGLREGDHSYASATSDDNDYNERMKDLERMRNLLVKSASERIGTTALETTDSYLNDNTSMEQEVFNSTSSSISILITASTSTTVDQLKEKLSAAMHSIPTDRMILLFKGVTLKEGKRRIPTESFEVNGSDIAKNDEFNEDLLVFRPRLFLFVLRAPEEVEEPEPEVEVRLYVLFLVHVCIEYMFYLSICEDGMYVYILNILNIYTI